MLCKYVGVNIYTYIYCLAWPLRDSKGNNTPVSVSTPVSRSGLLNSPLKGTRSKTSLQELSSLWL